MGSLKTKFLYQLSASFLHALIPLITFPYVARVLGPEKIGAINFVDYTAQIFITIANFGIPLYAVREIAKARESSTHLQKVVSELLSIHVIMAIISIAAFLATMRLGNTSGEAYSLIWLACINLFLSAFSFDWFIHGMEDFRRLSFRSLIVKGVIAILIFVLIKTAQDYLIYYMLLVGGSLLLMAYDIYYLNSKQISISFGKNFSKHLKPLSIFFLTTASVSIYTLMDTFLLGVLTTTLAVGFYTTVLKIIRLSQNFINDLGGVLLPRISYLIAKKDLPEISRILQLSSLYVFTVAVPAGFLFFLLAPEVIMVIAGNQYLNAVSTLRILALLPLIIGLSNIFGIQVLIPYGQEKQLLKAVFTGSIASILLCIIFCPLLKEDGAAIATVAAEIIVTIILAKAAYKHFHFKIPWRFLLTILLTSFLFIPVVFTVRKALPNDLLVLVISLVSCITIFGLVQLYAFANPVLQHLILFARSSIFKFNLKKG